MNGNVAEGMKWTKVVVVSFNNLIISPAVLGVCMKLGP
jgi:hypothetical protein